MLEYKQFSFITVMETELEAFNIALEQYLKLDEEIKTLLGAIKKRNLAKKHLSEILCNFLTTNKIKNVTLDGSYKGKTLESITSTSKAGFNRAVIVETIQNELADDAEMFDKIMSAISLNSNKILKETSKIKLSKNKSPKNTSNNDINTSINLLENI